VTDDFKEGRGSRLGNRGMRRRWNQIVPRSAEKSSATLRGSGTKAALIQYPVTSGGG
jgi:hypothetical protein